jgi:hypothetical protein
MCSVSASSIGVPMSERLSVEQTADTIQFQRIGHGPSHRRVGVSPLGGSGHDSERLRSSTGRAPSKRIVFKERNGPNLWLITAAVALVAAVAVFVGGVVVSQSRDSSPTYQSVYVPENALGGAQK